MELDVVEVLAELRNWVTQLQLSKQDVLIGFVAISAVYLLPRYWSHRREKTKIESNHAVEMAKTRTMLAERQAKLEAKRRSGDDRNAKRKKQ